MIILYVMMIMENKELELELEINYARVLEKQFVTTKPKYILRFIMLGYVCGCLCGGDSSFLLSFFFKLLF